VHLKSQIADEEGKKEPADWNRLLSMLGRAGYKGHVGLEYEAADAEAEVPRLAAELRSAVRKLSG
jgi:hydroxypyruvate isomerase